MMGSPTRELTGRLLISRFVFPADFSDTNLEVPN